MTDVVFQVPPAFDYLATVTWASSGALVGIRKHFDVVGVFVIALVSALGAGLVRDALFLQRTPVLLTDPVYLPLIALIVMLFVLFSGPLTRVATADTAQKVIDIIDAIGIPMFAVIGMQLAEGRDIPTAGVIFVGVVNGTGGGLLRDIVVRDVPAILRPGQFVALLLLLSCVLFVALKQYPGISVPEAAWAAIGTFFVLRVLTIRFNWSTRSVLPESMTDGGGR
ncbi:MAG TPA: TRIC cation channel family protein [Vicinamibacterales bacterium]|nr:TRIC cation channel family protein [Vicinamibacterales bacterium]